MTIDSEITQYEIHLGIVTKVLPLLDFTGKLKRGRIYFKSDTLTGGSEFSEPCDPAFPLAGKDGEGFFWYPQVGDQIEVIINVANEHPIPRILRMVYSSEDEPNPEFTEDEPFNKGWATRSGHILLFGDNPLLPKMKLAHGGGTGFLWEQTADPTEGIKETHTVEGNMEESILGTSLREYIDVYEENFFAEASRAHFGKLTEEIFDDVSRTIFGNLTDNIKGDVTINILGALTQVINSDYVEVVAGARTVAATGDHTLSGGGGVMKMAGGKVALGNVSGELLDLVDQIIDVVDQALADIQLITVPTAVGPSGVPVNAPAFIANQTVLAAIKVTLGLIKGTL